MFLIQTLIEEMKAAGMKGQEIANDLGISNSMVSSYRHQHFSPSLNVAMRVYADKAIVLHPYNEDSLKYEIELDTKRRHSVYASRARD